MNDRFTARRSLLLVLAVALPLLALRLLTPYQLQETDQGKQAQYVLDIVQNGNWLAPGSLGVAATKPPLYSWLAAVVSHAAGGISETTIRVPTVLAALGLVVVVWDIARRLAGQRVAAAAAIAVATSHHFIHLSGVVRTDGLLAFLLAAQLLLYVRTIDRDEAPLADVLAGSALAAAACLTKGPPGILSCAVVAVHLVATGRGRRVWRSAGLPALAGLAALWTWFVAAYQTRSDLYDTMVDDGFVQNVRGASLPNPVYYLLHMPFRLTPWVALLPPAGLLVWRAVRDRRTAPIPSGLSLCLAWILVHLAAFSFLTHQRPDLIYPAEPAVLLICALLVARPFGAWAPRSVAAVLAAAAVALYTPLNRHFVTAETPVWIPLAAAVFLVAAGAATLVIARRDVAVATFAGLAALGATNGFLDTVGDAARAERASYRTFGEISRAEAARRHARLVAVGVDLDAAMFDLRITSRSLPPESLADAVRPLVVVTTPAQRQLVEELLGPCDLVAEDDNTGSAREVPLVALATR